MAEFCAHAPGTFAWAELATIDQKAAVGFYCALFGWDARDLPIASDDVYTMFMLRGKEAAAAYTMRADEQQLGIPPHWNLYVSVVNVDDTASRALALGAKVLVAPFDVMDAGRMAVLEDPTGAVFHLWQAARHIGARVLQEAGALCWSELTTRDTAAAEAFYTTLFGWTAKHSAPSTGMPYTEFDGQAGMMAMPDGMPASVPSYWMPYFQVTDCEASTKKATSLGATLMVGPDDVPNTGRLTILRDGQGAMFALFQFAGR